jgi:hypothetical protein
MSIPPPLQFGSLPALIAAAVSLSDVESISDTANTTGSNETDVTGSNETDVTRTEVRASTGFVIAIAALGILLSLLWIIIRFCNIGLVNLRVKIFLIIVRMLCNRGQLCIQCMDIKRCSEYL